MQEMETRYTHSPEDIRHYSTEQLRKEFLVEKVFEPENQFDLYAQRSNDLWWRDTY